MSKDSKTNFAILIPAVLFVAAIVIFVAADPKTAASTAYSAFSFLTTSFAWYYHAIIIAIAALCLFLAFGPWGNKRLGKQEPEMKMIPWLGLIFSTAGSSSMFIWATLEPYSYAAAPAFNLEAFSTEAWEFALPYSLLHWGPSVFVGMILFGAIFGYHLHVRRTNAALPSHIIGDLIGEHRAKGFWGKLCDFIALVAIICGLATTMGISTQVMSELICYFTGIEHTFALDAIMIIIWTIGVIAVVFTKLTKGITLVSNIRLVLTYVFLIALFVLGPTAFILNYSWESEGILIQNLARMSTYTGATDGSTFTQDWTIFYWSWSICYYVASGLFYARISRGRTLRQYILGGLGGCTVGIGVIFLILSSTTTNIIQADPAAYTEIMTQYGSARMVIELWRELPLHNLFMLILLVLMFISTATFLINYSYTLAMSTTKQAITNNAIEVEEKEPAKWLRIMWAVCLGALGLSLTYIGGITVMQHFTIIGSAPMSILVILLIISFFKSVKKHGWTYVRYKNDGAGEFIEGEDVMGELENN